VAVRPDLRGKGVGTLATAAAIRTAGPRHVTRVWLLTETAEGFFSGLGFRTVGRQELPAPVAGRADAAGECASATAMRIELPG
jgi:amino-acid N-acetyltransferase